MKVLIINGSPHETGCTSRALREAAEVLEREGIETETLRIGSRDIRGCISCNTCSKLGRCVFPDAVNEAAEIFAGADGLLIGSPVYYAGANGTLLSFLDRLFYSTGFDKTMKVGACVLSSRRAGSTSAYDEITKYFSISGMPIATSTYWNEVHGFTAEDVEKDREGLQTMRNLARNMAFLIKAIRLGKERYGLPETEHGAFTSFPDGLQ